MARATECRRMDSIRIENDALRVDTLPGYGARVSSLVEKASGRDWIFHGGQSANTAEDAVYSRDEAVGWDECFPTVSAFEAQATPWKRRLRDHGDLWGRPWRVDSSSPTRLSTTYVDPMFEFTRELSLDGATLVADYRVVNKTRDALPYLWALHGLLTVTPADRIVMDGAEVMATYLSLGGKRYPTPVPFGWPGPDAAFPLNLGEVQPASINMAGKLLAHGIPSCSVALGHAGEWLTIDWDAPIDDLGLWFAYGAWPVPGELHHIALEPQSANADHIGQAIERGAPPMAPGATISWRVRMSVSASGPG
jgi:galactose mutarotase-like enzyme